MTRVSTKSPTKLLERLWATSTYSQKKALLRSRGLSLTWAKTKTIKEMVNRGGGLVAKDLLNLVKVYAKRNPNVKNVRFTKKG